MDFNGFMSDLPQRPLLGHPHLIISVNDEEDEPLLALDEPFMNHRPELEYEDIDVIIHALTQPRPVYGPSQIFQVNLNSTRLPNDWPVYSGMDYFGLEKVDQDEDQNIIEEEDSDDEAKQGPIKRPISTNYRSLEDMIKSSAAEPYIATIGLQEQNTTGPVFGPILEPPSSHQ